MEPIVEEEEEVAQNIQEENKEKENKENKEKENSDTQNPTNNNDKTNSDQGIVCDTGMVYEHTVDSGNSKRLNSKQSLISKHFW